MRISDWSSDVCSSDLIFCVALPLDRFAIGGVDAQKMGQLAVDGHEDRKSVVEGKSVSVRVDLGGSRIIKKKQNISKNRTEKTTSIRNRDEQLEFKDTMKL